MITMTQCPKGHFYDSEKNPSCPYCAMQSSEVGATTPLRPVEIPAPAPTPAPAPAPMPPAPPVPDDIDLTQSFYSAMATDPVVGWLVAIEGTCKGKDFRLCSGRNYIGRGVDMDIQLVDDAKVSRGRHAIVIFDPVSQKALCQAGDSRSLFYLNNQVVTDSVELKQGDILTIGGSKLMFVPFCGALHQWEADD